MQGVWSGQFSKIRKILMILLTWRKPDLIDLMDLYRGLDVISTEHVGLIAHLQISKVCEQEV